MSGGTRKYCERLPHMTAFYDTLSDLHQGILDILSFYDDPVTTNMIFRPYGNYGKHHNEEGFYFPINPVDLRKTAANIRWKSSTVLDWNNIHGRVKYLIDLGLIKKTYKELRITSYGSTRKQNFVAYGIVDDVLKENYILEDIRLAPAVILSSIANSVKIINKKGGKLILKLETKPMSEEFLRVLLDRLSEMGSPT